MKKSLLVISVILLIAGLFISCNSEAAETGSDLAYVKFADDSKGLNSFITPWSGESPAVDTLYWYYQATNVGGVGSHGATSTWTRINSSTGLSGQIGPFSLGLWKFAIIGCSDTNTPTATYNPDNKEWSVGENVMYYGFSGPSATEVTEDTAVAIKRGTNTINVTIHSTVVPPNSLTLTWNVDYNAPDATYNGGKVYYNVTVGTTPYEGESTISSQKANMSKTTGISVAVPTEFVAVTVTFDVYADEDKTDDYKLSTGSISFPALKGSTVAITGDIDDLGYEYAEIDDVNTDSPSYVTPTIDANDVAYVLKSSTITGYDTLEQAIAAAADGDTVGLLKDISSPQINIVDKSITLNGNGHTLTSSASNNTNHTGNTLSGYSCFAIALYTTDSKAQELIDGDSNPIQLTVENLKIVSTSARYGLYFDGYVVGTVDSCDINIPGSSVCSGAYINSDHKVYPSTVTVKGSEIGFSSGESVDDWMGTTLSVSGGGILIVDGGTYEGIKSLSTFTSGGKITVNSGTFTGEIKNYAIASNYSNLKYAENDSSVNSVIEINGGVFTSCTFDCDPGTVTTITGGTFDADPTDYVPSSGYTITHNTEAGTWTVTPSI